MWRNLSLGKKILSGIGTVLVLLVVVGGWSLQGIDQMVDDGLEVVAGNRLRGEILQREVDHLNWVNRVSAFINDSHVTEIGVQLDHTKCGFGKWFYGEGRKYAESLVPALIPILTAIEDPHRLLHESARKIEKTLTRADSSLPEFLANKEIDHLVWSGKVQDAILFGQAGLNVQLDPSKCGLGRFMSGHEGEKMRGSDSELSNLLDAITPAHKRLHAAGDQINAALKEGNREAATQHYHALVVPALNEVRANLAKMQERARNNLKGKQEAEQIFAKETQIQLEAVKKLLHDVVGVTSDNILSEQQMLSNASNTRHVIVIVSLLAIILGIILSILIPRSIVSPVLTSLNFAEQVAQGDLTHSLELKQKDEVGRLVVALNIMVERLREVLGEVSNAANSVALGSKELSDAALGMSEGATEQAASVEETSSSMEEIAANIQQNSDNAQTTQTIAQKAAVAAQNGG